MNKSDIAYHVALQLPEIAKDVVGSAVNLLLECMIESLGNGDRIEIRGFGTFCVRQYRHNRQLRNPKTRKTFEGMANNRARFKAGKELAERVDWNA